VKPGDGSPPWQSARFRPRRPAEETTGGKAALSRSMQIGARPGLFHGARSVIQKPELLHPGKTGEILVGHVFVKQFDRHDVVDVSKVSQHTA